MVLPLLVVRSSGSHVSSLIPPRRVIDREGREAHDEQRVSPSRPPPDLQAQMLAGITQFFAQFARNNADVDRKTRPDAVYERFRKMGPKDFWGKTDPMVVEGWIKSIEMVFTFMELQDADRVRCPTYLLKDDARLCWEGASVSVNLQTLTWEGFKKVLYSKYFPDKCDCSVAEFVRKFEQGCPFVPLIANDPREKLRHFMDGLWPILRRDVRIAGPLTYVVAALQRQFQQPAKKPFQGSNKGERQHQPQKKVAQKSEYPVCPKCSRKREGEWMIYIAGVATNALIDFGATHSFISDGFVKFLRDKPTKMVLPMPEFDIILGMDWLSKNGVSIDFQRKSMRVRLLGEEEFVFESSNSMPRMISYLQARKLMLRGYQAFLASIISAPVTTSQTVADVPVVRDFPDVFPDDVAGIPPDHQVEFSIDLMSGTMPISKAPYILVLVEMKELK
ncbi:uncharacterized protein [Primulina huaijiensis]|uniref:uncharacterized protein n=1 Tax=Primulina huaijiensis TaxID=1492673 RepID=UPI003CC6EE48